jgi:hypothetical protein
MIELYYPPPPDGLENLDQAGRARAARAPMDEEAHRNMFDPTAKQMQQETSS